MIVEPSASFLCRQLSSAGMPSSQRAH